MIKSSKEKDKKYSRYDKKNFIDLEFLQDLYDKFEGNPLCYYDDCKIDMQCMKYQSNLITVERLDNSVGHAKDNCVFCCLSCNNGKKSNRITSTE